MRYKSTRVGVTNIDFTEVVFENYASDGGLFVPQYIPSLSQSTLLSWTSLPYNELCARILSLFVNDEIRNALPAICAKAYSQTHFASDPIIPISRFDDDNLYLLELFHGQTLAFKDFSLHLVAQIMQHILLTRNQHANILVHTHGDTGPAAANSIALLGEQSRCKLFILYPLHQCSEIQHDQMAVLMHKHPKNIRIYATDKNMDEQRVIVKQLLAEPVFVKRYKICGMNSINFVRILGQLCYYIYLYLRLQPQCDGYIDVSIPSGAFGNALACCLAKSMGVKIRNIIACTNEYDIVHRLFSNGDFSTNDHDSMQEHVSLSPAMDTIIPYNIERYLWMVFGGDCQMVKSVMETFERSGAYQFDLKNDLKLKQRLKSLVTCSYRVNNEMIKHTMVAFVRKYQYLCCPHSITAVYGALQFRKENENHDEKEIPMIAVATAHPAKFPEIIDPILAKQIDDKMRRCIDERFMVHRYLPNKEDKRAYVELKDGGGDWKQEWLKRIKSDIINMNRQKAKL